MCDEITYPFLNFKLYQTCDYLSMMGLKLNHVSKTGPSKHFRPSSGTVLNTKLDSKFFWLGIILCRILIQVTPCAKTHEVVINYRTQQSYYWDKMLDNCMMTSSHRNESLPLVREYTCHRWFPSFTGRKVGLCSFCWHLPEQAVGYYVQVASDLRRLDTHVASLQWKFVQNIEAPRVYFMLPLL